MEELDLYTLLNDVREGLVDLFPDRVWVRAEINSLSVRGGHCYLGLSQHEGGFLKAKCDAVIWKSVYPQINASFKSVTGADLATGQEVLFLVSVSFHEAYGLKLNITDINPQFTLGEKERKRKETIARLEKEGLFMTQKELALPEIPYTLAVISASGAAGFGDFCTHLLNNEFGFAYKVDLYEAIMQGENCPRSVCEAFSLIETSGNRYDAVLVMRGGGSEMDLACFDDYDLCSAIARCPFPVLTAIGHERDYHIADMVANMFVKTPTALADVFLDITKAEDERISSYDNRLYRAFLAKISELSSKVDCLETRIQSNDPRNVLKRGFSLALDEKGVKLNGVKGLSAGDRIRILFADGSVEATVDKIS